MAPEKKLEQAYANTVKEDIGSVTFINANIHDPRLQQGPNGRAFFKDLFQKTYGYNLDTKGVYFVATVLSVLAGPNSSPEDVDNPKTTTIHTAVNPNPSLGRKGNKPLVRVIARVPMLDAAVNFPKTDKDYIRLGSHGEYIAVDHDSRYDDIVVGSEIWVILRTPTTSPVDGKHSGQIIGHISKPQLSDLVKKLTSSKTPFRPECKADFVYSGTTPKFLTGKTDPKPSVQNPIIRKFKTKIKTGMYGNGSAQTKAHFNAAISKVNQSVKSFYYEIPGAAPDQNNSFIWVGHLRNNGYMDVLDRPINLGRETIIYAPMNLNVYAPIELKYYFHDRGGFGHAWIHGPNTTTKQAIATAALAKNDFRKKIGPAIKDMIRDKRNFILVIPEMAFSRGFGTGQNNVARISAMSKGKKVDPDEGGLASLTMRTALNPSSRAAVKEYLRGLPAAAIQIFEDSSWYTLGFEVLDTQTPRENLLQKTHLRERESVTFDGSFTGGKFGEFHQEVLGVISEYLSNDARNNIAHTSITADGLGGINLASVVKSMVLSATHRAAEVSFKSVDINRIDYIESGLDLAGNYSFAKTPAYAIYEDYILQRAEKPGPFEFNYITDPSTNVGLDFFTNLGAKLQFEEGNKSPGPKGEKKFSLSAGSSNSVISMHTAPKSNNEETHIKVGYSFSRPNNTEETGQPSLFIPDTTSMMTPTIDPVPDHAATTGTPSEGKAAEYQQEQEKITKRINSIRDIIKGLEDKAKRCDPGSPSAAFCTKGNFSLVKFQGNYLALLENIKKWFYYKHMIDEELVIAKILNNKEALQEELNNPTHGVSARIKTIKEQNSSEDYFNGDFGIKDFAKVIGDTTGVLKDVKYSFNSAAQRLQAATTPGLSVLPYIKPGLDDLDVFVPQFPPDISSDPPPGLFCNVLERMAKEEALVTTRDRLAGAIEKASPAEPKPSVEGCDPAPYKIREFGTRVPSPKYFDPATTRIGDYPCSGKDIRLVSNYEELYGLIPWTPKKSSLLNQGDRYSTAKTSLKDIGEEHFQTKTFKYKARARNNSVIYRTSPPVWSCMADRIASAWDAACNISGYIPFKITSGIKGFEKKDTGVTAYETGVSVDSFGLSINVDPPLTGYDGDGDALHSIFTGAWTPGFVDQYAGELYDLGVFDDGYIGPGDTFLDNAYQFYGYERRDAYWWNYAEHEYDGPSGEGEKKQDYDKIMEPAEGSPIVPAGANPVLWLLTFCEKSGMRWGNSFFMKKRHRGTKSGWEIFGFDILNDTPPFWTIAEQRRIAAIYGIPDVVARINAISWTPTSFDKHMHFQFYSGKPIIGWKEIDDMEGT